MTVRSTECYWYFNNFYHQVNPILSIPSAHSLYFPKFYTTLLTIFDAQGRNLSFYSFFLPLIENYWSPEQVSSSILMQRSSPSNLILPVSSYIIFLLLLENILLNCVNPDLPRPPKPPRSTPGRTCSPPSIQPGLPEKSRSTICWEWPVIPRYPRCSSAKDHYPKALLQLHLLRFCFEGQIDLFGSVLFGQFSWFVFVIHPVGVRMLLFGCF